MVDLFSCVVCVSHVMERVSGVGLVDKNHGRQTGSPRPHAVTADGIIKINLGEIVGNFIQVCMHCVRNDSKTTVAVIDANGPLVARRKDSLTAHANSLQAAFFRGCKLPLDTLGRADHHDDGAAIAVGSARAAPPPVLLLCPAHHDAAPAAQPRRQADAPADAPADRRRTNGRRISLAPLHQAAPAAPSDD